MVGEIEERNLIELTSSVRQKYNEKNLRSLTRVLVNLEPNFSLSKYILNEQGIDYHSLKSLQGLNFLSSADILEEILTMVRCKVNEYETKLSQIKKNTSQLYYVSTEEEFQSPRNISSSSEEL